MKVSVCIITYNHEKFIAQAIDSVLMQQAEFDYELVIGEDCSTDNTRTIVIDYQKRYPEKIKLVLPEKNLGMLHNFVNTVNSCQGQYIALLEGDDYWTDSFKIQKQADYLDNHPECSLCYHPETLLYDATGIKRDLPHWPSSQVTFDLEDLLKWQTIFTGSVLFRNGLVKYFPKWYYELSWGDRPFFVFLAQHGRVGYLSDNMGVYRLHPGGLWTGMDPVKRLLDGIKYENRLNEYFQYQYDSIAKANVARIYFVLSSEYCNRGDNKMAMRYLYESLRTNLFNKTISSKERLYLALKLFLPGLLGMSRTLYKLMIKPQYLTALVIC